MISVLTASPAPVMPTLGAIHVRTSLIFLNRRFAFRAFMSTYLICPTFVKSFLSLSTSFSMVPIDLALEAKVVSAFIASHSFTFGRRCYDIFTSRSWAKLLVLWPCNFKVKSEPFILSIHVLWENLLKLLLSNLLFTFIIWALYRVHLAVLDQVAEVSFEAVFAKEMTAF